VNEKGVEAVYGFVLTGRAMLAAAHRIYPRLSANELAVMIGLNEYADQDGWCRVSQNTLAMRLGMRREHVNRAISGLVAHDIIAADARKDGVTLGYQFVRDAYEFYRANMDEVNEAREQKGAERAERRAAAGKGEVPEEKQRKAPKPPDDEASRAARLEREEQRRLEEEQRAEEQDRRAAAKKAADEEQRRIEDEQRRAEREAEKAAAEEQRRVHEEKLANEVLPVLGRAGRYGMTWAGVVGKFPHEGGVRVGAILALLESRGLARHEGEGDAGRPDTGRWFNVEAAERAQREFEAQAQLTQPVQRAPGPSEGEDFG
jgi:hypothetical protein